MNDQYNAFMNEHVKISPTGSGCLNGKAFAVKDVYEITNITASAGNPDWLRTHPPANRNAPVISKLLRQGGELRGTTHTDELMYSLNGENFHYGTPVNPKVKERIPGGSSSGSAVAVSAGLVDFALGTDTGGSVRVPSSYCGIYGIRPTHGSVPMEGVIPLAKSFDTVGWMSRDPELLLKVGEVLLPQAKMDDMDFRHLYFEEEAWSYLEGTTYNTLIKVNDTLLELDIASNALTVSEEGLAHWAQLFRNIQGIEIWQEHGKWITEVQPSFGPDICERFEWASTLNEEVYPNLMLERRKMKEKLSQLLQTNGLLVIPTAPGEAPMRQLPADKIEQFRTRTMKITCIAGLTGFPQVTIPFINPNGVPIGLSFIANENQDIKLLNWVNRLIPILKNRKLPIE